MEIDIDQERLAFKAWRQSEMQEERCWLSSEQIWLAAKRHAAQSEPTNEQRHEAACAALLASAEVIPAKPGIEPARTKLAPMQSEDDQDAGITRQWHFDCDGHYIDVACDDGKYSIFVKDRATKAEAWLDQADIPATAGIEPAKCRCSTCLDASGETVEIFGMLVPASGARMVLCQTCGNKRCPHANDHRNACTNSNEPGQAGSSYANQPAPSGASVDSVARDALKDHNVRQLVNDLRDIALKFHATQQLRERISGAVGQFLAAMSPTKAGEA